MGSLHRLERVAPLEEGGQALQRGGFPGAEDVGMDAMFGGQLDDGLGFLQQLLHDTRFEGRTVSLIHRCRLPDLGRLGCAVLRVQYKLNLGSAIWHTSGMPQQQTQEPVDWREGRRMRAWELHRQGWKRKDIAAALDVTPGAVSHWMK